MPVHIIINHHIGYLFVILKDKSN